MHLFAVCLLLNAKLIILSGMWLSINPIDDDGDDIPDEGSYIQLEAAGIHDGTDCMLTMVDEWKGESIETIGTFGHTVSGKSLGNLQTFDFEDVGDGPQFSYKILN